MLLCHTQVDNPCQAIEVHYWLETYHHDASSKVGMMIMIMANPMMCFGPFTMGSTNLCWWTSQTSPSPLFWKAWDVKKLSSVGCASCSHPILLTTTNGGLSLYQTSCDSLPLSIMESMVSSGGFCTPSYACFNNCNCMKLVHHNCGHWDFEPLIASNKTLNAIQNQFCKWH